MSKANEAACVKILKEKEMQTIVYYPAKHNFTRKRTQLLLIFQINKQTTATITLKETENTVSLLKKASDNQND